jgi:hypothetical protein
MQITGSTQSFKGLNMNYVSTADREMFIKGNYKRLQQLGEKYDIDLISCYTDIPGFSGIDIYVKPLKKNLSFLKKIFPTSGRSYFKTKYEHFNNAQKAKQDFLKAVDEAIANLGEKISLHK